MQQSGRTYIAIDLKSFYASVECMERGLDPLTTNLVVADASRTEKTICLAVSPSLKAYGISGRARLFEVVERVKEVNAERRRKAGCLSEKSFNANELAADPSREVDYGYRLVKDHLEIQEDEASIIRHIFDRYLAGVSMENIAKEITALGCPTRDGTQYWQLTSIQYILQNEKYAGDSLSQKKYTTRSFPRQQKINHGERKQYLVIDSHPAIISREIFQKVQELLTQRSAAIHPRSDVPHAFARKVVCGHCGTLCKRKNCGGSVNWACRRHDKSITACPNTQVPEEQMKNAFLHVYYNLKHYGTNILTQLISDLYAVRTGSLLWSENIVEINKQISDIASQERLLAQLKQQGVVDPDIFISRSNQLAERRRELKLQKERILRSEEDHTIQQTQDLLDVLESGPDWLDDFDEQLFSDMVEKIVVVDNETLRFRLLNGLEVTEKIERTRR